MHPNSIAQIICENINIIESKDSMPMKMLGKTKVMVSRMGLGGQGGFDPPDHMPVQKVDEDECTRMLNRAYELGINYFDTSRMYGRSHEIFGKGIKSFRKKIYLNSKTDDRTRDGSLRLLEKALRDLQTDHLDGWQIHHLDKMAEVNEVAKKGGALEALIKAKEEGTVKYIGFTGHENPEVLVEMSKRHPFDTALCAVNAADIHVKPSFIKTFLPEARKQNLGVIGMKVFAQGFMFNPKGIITVWEPLYYTLSQDVDTAIVGCDNTAQLEENVMLVKAFKKLSPEKLREIEDKTKGYVRRAAFFRSRYGGHSSKDKLGGL